MTHADALDTVARTLWGEARGEGLAGMIAVANVIANRVANPGWWGKTWVEVCRKKWQFSCWLPSDPTHGPMLRADRRNPAFRVAMGVAQRVINGVLSDTTAGADHYYNPKSVPEPKWARGRKPVAVIGAHVFYRIGLS